MASSRKKANSKVVLILFLVIILILVGWYYLFYTPTIENTELLQRDAISKQSDIDLLNIRVAKQTQMLNDIEYLKTVNPAVPAYDNYKQLATVINVIIAQTSKFQLQFSEPQMAQNDQVPSVNTARRNLAVSFEADSYEIAKEIIADIQDIPFRLQISSTTISIMTSNIFRNEEEEQYIPSLGYTPVKVSLALTFFENQYSE